MKYRNKLGRIFLGLGGVMLAASLVLTLWYGLRERKIRREAERAMAILQEAVETAVPGETTLPVYQTQTAVPEPAGATDPTDPITLTSELVDGHEYVGYLEFPSLERKLPIIKIKYLEDLQVAPCLEKGSPHTNDAVISAHNYPSHFGPIRDWEGGETVIFTDLQGNAIEYAVATVETIQPKSVEKVMQSDYDLVLYTCTTGGAKRVMLGCNRK